MKLVDTKTRKMADSLSRSVDGNRTSVYTEDTTQEYYFIDINHLKPYSNQARRYFNEERLSELSLTIQEHGVRQPLTILPIENQPGYFEIISGERRWRAAQKAGLTKVPCLILKKEKNVAEIAIIENIQRENLHPIELGNACIQLISSGVCNTQEQVADRLGMSRTKVSECISYAKIPNDVQAIILERELSDREVLRRLMSMKNASEMLNSLDGYNNKPIYQNSKDIKMSTEPQSHSVIRINYLSDKSISINKRGISKLPHEKKILLRENLKEIIKELEDEM